LKKTGWEPSGSLELYLVSDEETMGFQGAGHLVGTGAVKPDFVIVGEPTSLRVVRAQRGAYWFRVRTRGVAAHGSAPQNGVNAILHMAEILQHLEETLPDISHPVVGGPTISVGTIQGGEKTNIVPASCAVEVDRRSIPGETRDDVTASLQAAVDRARVRFPDLDATVELSFESRPFEVAQDSRIVMDVSEAVGESSGAPAELIGFRGASDARFFAEAGAQVVVCGPGDIGLAHTADEWIDLDEFHRGTLAYARAFVLLDA
jgi:acetylornithine deacetylase/succinyl-diaminopimelate desuccinylase-like protein